MCWSIVMKPSAPLNVVTEPEPLPIGYADGPCGPCTRPTSRYSVRPRSEFTRMGSVAATVCFRSAGRPAYARITGARNSWNVKIADVGNPGRMTTGLRRVTARQIGLPGLSATPWATTPGSRSACTTRYEMSPAPLEVPPENTTTSDSRPCASAAASAASSSRMTPRCTGTPPSSPTAAPMIAALESYTAPGRSGSPGATISLPVEKIATRGRRKTATSRTPSAASTPISRDVSCCPARSTVSPRAMSVPA